MSQWTAVYQGLMQSVNHSPLEWSVCAVVEKSQNSPEGAMLHSSSWFSKCLFDSWTLETIGTCQASSPYS